MCGIAGIIALDSDRCHALVTAMANRLKHRGPDSTGVVSHPDATLGMTRLAIVDIAHGHQPMLNEDESVALVFNGEIYNAPSLRRELKSQFQFRTHSDTEVILRLYEKDPDNVEKYLVGMWAFAIHDRRRRQVILSRDRFGIKPLFIADTGTALAFASELRAFDKNLAPFDRLFKIDHDSAHAMISWSYVPDARTIYKGVRRLPPATRLTLDLNTGNLTGYRYWKLRPSAEASKVNSLEDACAGVEFLLRRSVREHLESDVPVATLLSGGIDSSLITAHASYQAYNIGFTDACFDESPIACEVATQVGAPLTVITLDEQAAIKHLPDALAAYDEPFGDSSSLATYLLTRTVAKDFKVALSGDGGDEVFGGYRKYQYTQFRRVNARMFGKLAPWMPLAKTAPLMRHPSIIDNFTPTAESYFESAYGSPYQKMLAADLGSMLPNDMLTKIDRASMACSLEVRVPFLDHRLVEYGVGLPEKYTLGPFRLNFKGKRVLRELYEKRFGPTLANRKKQGFSIPVQAWLKGPFDSECQRLFDKKRLDYYGILSSDALSDGKHRAWIEKAPLIAWHAFALASWCEITLGDGNI